MSVECRSKMQPTVADSGHDTTSTLDTSITDTTGTTLTLGKVPYHKQLDNSAIDVLPKLPSHKFRYSVWHDLRETCLTGDQLHAPRVRAGPPEKEKLFYKIKDDGLPIHHDLYGQQRQNHMNEFENWGKATVINLSYQELSEDFQLKNFNRILSQCASACTVNVSHNTIVTLNKIKFPCCEYLNVDHNYITSFEDFPYLPKVKKITAVFNAIKKCNGLQRFSSSPLEELTLKGNPVFFTLNYRAMVFSKLPNLKILDGIPRLPEDNIQVEDGPESNTGCTMM